MYSLMDHTSEASSISSTPDGAHSSTQLQKVICVESGDSDEQRERDIRLEDRLDLHKRSNQELNLIDSMELMHTSSVTTHTPEGPEPRVFSCNYCQRKFYSSQALGGHQNAHKRERTLAKRGQRLGASMMAAATAFGHAYLQPHHHLPSMSQIPAHSVYNRSLGIQLHSMIQKPSYTAISGNPYGHQDWARQPIEQQPAVGKLFTETNQASAAIGASSRFHTPRFETVKTNIDLPTDHIVNGCWWPGGGISMSDQEDLQKLDLSLKL